MHPEVKYIGFLTLLYAGTISILSFKYYFLMNKVKKLKRWNISAGNIFFSKLKSLNSTSETLRNEIIVTSYPEEKYPEEKIRYISDHIPTHLKPTNDNNFGYYLAGLIDGDGHFSKIQQLIIVFNSLDLSLAYFIKQKLGYGKIKKVKDKNTFLLVVSSKKGLEKVIRLINEKIRTENKYNQIINNILKHKSFICFKNEIDFKLDSSKDLENQWLAGFSDADASFQIKVLNHNERIEIRLNFQINQKKKEILLLIKNFLGGNIGYRKSQDTYYYGSTSFGSARNVIDYFDHFHLLSSKYINYLKWRKSYLIIQNKDHLNKKGINKIIKLKNSMNNSNKEEFIL